MKRNCFFMVLCFMWSALSVTAQGESAQLVLTLESAKQVAMEHNRTLKNASLDIQKAEASRWQSIASMLPQVNAALDYQNMLGYKMKFTEMELPMPPSGTIGITASAAISGAQIVGVRLRTLAMEMADINQKRTEQQIANQVKSIYYSILVMEQTVDLLGKNLTNLEKLYESTLRSVEVGVAEEVDADQLSVQVATMQTTISSMKRSLEMLYNSMRLQLGVPANQAIALAQTIDELISIDNALALLADNFILDNNYDYQLVKENVRMAKQQVNLNAWSYGPTLSAYYQYSGKTYFDKKDGFNMTPPNAIGVSLSVPLFSSGKNFSSVRSAKIDYKKQLNTLADTEESLKIQHSQLRYNLSSAFESYTTQKKNVDVSQRVFTNISNKYEYGMASSLEVTNSGTNLITAQSNYVQALLELVSAQIELEKLLNK